MLEWIINIFTDGSFIQAILVLSLVCAVGLGLGKFKFKGLSFGVSSVFFVGILAGHFGLSIDPKMLLLAQNFGLILFVYALGLQVGPSFFPSFKQGGIKLNLLSIAVMLIGFALTFLIYSISGLDYPAIMGLFSGAVTNTPMLGAAQQTLLQANPQALESSKEMAMACAVGYPFGIIGMILTIIILKIFFGKDSRKTFVPHDNQTFISEFEVSNPAVFGKTIKDITSHLDFHLVVSRVWKSNDVIIPNGDTVLYEGERVLLLMNEHETSKAELLFGRRIDRDWNKKDIDWNSIDSQLVSRHILVTKSSVNGAKLGELHLRNIYGINITRVNRAGVDILPSSNLRLQIGDKLTIVGESKSIDNVSHLLGNQEKELRNPNLFSIFIGIMTGLLLGSIPFAIPGISVPVKIGIAGGPIIAGILMGAYGHRLRFTTFTTQSANLMLRQMGITIYLAGLGLSAGPGFFETVFRPEGIGWIAISLVLCLVPVLIVGVLSSAFCKVSFSSNFGMLCGAMANPFALSYGLSFVDDDEPSVAYATVYPVSMFLRVILAQVAMLLIL